MRQANRWPYQLGLLNPIAMRMSDRCDEDLMMCYGNSKLAVRSARNQASRDTPVGA
jgi:hypothetical protein